MKANEETMIAIPADPNDPEDFDVSVAGLKRGLIGREVRLLRRRLGMSQEEFAETYGIPTANIRQYEIGRHMPPPAVRAYLKTIAADPDAVCAALAAKTARAFDIPDVKAA
jgi:putative transcriptional regulator